TSRVLDAYHEVGEKGETARLDPHIAVDRAFDEGRAAVRLRNRRLQVEASLLSLEGPREIRDERLAVIEDVARRSAESESCGTAPRYSGADTAGGRRDVDAYPRRPVVVEKEIAARVDGAGDTSALRDQRREVLEWQGGEPEASGRACLLAH